MLFYLVSALPYILQLLLIIHIIRNGKPFLWLWLIVFLPYIGGIVYLVMEVLPDLRSGGSVSRMGAAVANAVNPGRPLAELEELVKRQDTITNRTKLADCYLSLARYDEALALYDSCLTGPYADDEVLLVKKIQALYLSGDGGEAKRLMDEFKKEHRLQDASQVLLDLQVSGEWDKLMELFTGTNNFRVGYVCAEHFAEIGDGEQVRKVVEIMEENLRLYKYLRRTDNYEWYKKTKKRAARLPD
ncbi:MAG: hypothetical protein IJR93_05850 [Treponema sp.]|nr:hypothetical protein [Treponema sp.]MBQ7166446.1 hypothetical protein [Treponema sp.]